MIELFNTLTGEKEEFEPLDDNNVTVYYCGMTLQESPHIGHMRAALTSDILNRYLRYRGFNVTLLVNFTDIDDKVIVKSNEEGKGFREIAADYEVEYREASDKLNIREADFYPRATQHIEEIIDLVKNLEQKGFTYEKEGNVFFRVRKFQEYGKLSGKKIEDLRSGERVAVDERKEDPLDFTLWKASKKGEPYWYSPWGRGRPGWHIECSAMSMHYLGETLDIHGGGSDLIFPHHENEIAQSEAATEKPFAKYWMHNEMLNIKGEKMSKSLLNFIPVKELTEKFNPNSIRLYLLQAHYRKQLNYNQEILKQAESGWQKIKDFIHDTAELDGPILSDYMEQFEKHMDDDLNTPRAMALVFNLISDGINSSREKKGSYRKTVLTILEILGFKIEKESGKRLEPVLDRIIKLRNNLRKEGEYELADRIRNVLEESGIAVKDTKNGTSWRLK